MKAGPPHWPRSKGAEGPSPDSHDKGSGALAPACTTFRPRLEAGWHQFSGGPPLIGLRGTYQPGDVEALAFTHVAGRRDLMDRVRALKPHVPLLGKGGLPLRDLWELQKSLAP